MPDDPAHDLKAKSGVRFSDHAKDRFIAPGVSSFESADIPDMSAYDPQSRHWVSNHFLNSLLRAPYNAPHNAYAYNFMRRAEAAFSEHAEARLATLAFLEDGQSPSRYARAILHWEVFLSQCWHGYLLLLGFFGEKKVFEKGNASTEERLHGLYNAMKHVESRIDNAELGQMVKGATVPVWLTNHGIESTDAFLTYTETGGILRDLAKWASILEDPLQMADKFRALDKEPPGRPIQA
jgi:hypothetical protein